MIESIERQIKPAVLAVMTSVAALTGMGAGQPRNTQRTPQKAPVVQRAKVSSGQVKKAPSIPVKKTALRGVERENTPAVSFSIPYRPDLKFSNKLSSALLPTVAETNFYTSAQYQRICKNDALRAASPYVPDIFYEKSKLPYTERIKFYESPDYWIIEDAVRKEFDKAVGKKLVHGLNLRTHIAYICRELIIYGRPLATLPTETESLREAVDLCGLTQLGKWMDIQKAQNRDHRYYVPKEYDEVEALRQSKHLLGILRMYGDAAYTQIVGIRSEKPINDDCPYYSEQDFSHLTAVKKKKLLEMLYLLPENIKNVPRSGARATWNEYEKIKADETGYAYFGAYIKQRLPKKWEKDELIEYQKLCLEMLTYGRPEVLLKAKGASLEQIIYICHFRNAEDFYRRQKGEKVGQRPFDQLERMIYDREANALVTLGKKYKHMDWVKFGDEMLKAPPPVQVIAQEQNQDENTLASKYTEEFSCLSSKEKKELTELAALLPEKVLRAPVLDTGRIYALYNEIQADQTGYRYIQERRPGLSKEEAAKVQKLAMEMVIYKRPLALLRAEDYSLEQVMKVCHFRFADSFYRWRQKDDKKLGKTNEMGLTMMNMEAKALMDLGKRFNHPEWGQFGQEMQDTIQKCEVVGRHNDSQMIDNRVAKAADAPRVRNQ